MLAQALASLDLNRGGGRKRCSRRAPAQHKTAVGKAGARCEARSEKVAAAPADVADPIDPADVVKRGVLFVQARGGQDHFQECMVTLDKASQLQVRLVGQNLAMRRSFDRGLDLRTFAEAQLSRRTAGSRQLFVLKLVVLDSHAVHLISESEKLAVEWHRLVCEALSDIKNTNTVWMALEHEGDAPAVLRTLKALSEERQRAVCCAPRNGVYLAHALCGAAPRSGSEGFREAIEAVLDLWPDVVSKRCQRGLLPVHHLLRSLAGCSLAVRESSETAGLIVLLLQRDVDTVLEPYNDVATGSRGLAIHLACAALAKSAAQVVLGMDCPRRRMNEFLGEPAHLLQRNECNQTALHVALKALDERLRRSTHPQLCTDIRQSEEEDNAKGPGNEAAATSASGERDCEQVDALHDEEAKCSGSSDDDADEIEEAQTLCILLASLESHALCAQDSNGDTPVHLAARQNSYPVLRHLLETNAGLRSLRLTNSQGQTSLDVLLHTQREASLTGNRDVLVACERCITLLRLGPRQLH